MAVGDSRKDPYDPYEISPDKLKEYFRKVQKRQVEAEKYYEVKSSIEDNFQDRNNISDIYGQVHQECRVFNSVEFLFYETEEEYKTSNETFVSEPYQVVYDLNTGSVINTPDPKDSTGKKGLFGVLIDGESMSFVEVLEEVENNIKENFINSLDLDESDRDER